MGVFSPSSHDIKLDHSFNNNDEDSKQDAVNVAGSAAHSVSPSVDVKGAVNQNDMAKEDVLAAADITSKNVFRDRVVAFAIETQQWYQNYLTKLFNHRHILLYAVGFIFLAFVLNALIESNSQQHLLLNQVKQLHGQLSNYSKQLPQDLSDQTIQLEQEFAFQIKQLQQHLSDQTKQLDQERAIQTKQLSQQISDQIHQAQEQIIASINESQQYLIHQLLESQRQLFSSMSTFPLEIPSLQFRELVRNGSVTASDSDSDYWNASHSLLNAVWKENSTVFRVIEDGWMASQGSTDNSGQIIGSHFIQAELPANMNVRAIRIQGRANHWVTKFQLKFQSDDPSSDWIDMGTPSSFDGCHDAATIVTHDLRRFAIKARRVRLYPLEVRGLISLRWEVVFEP